MIFSGSSNIFNSFENESKSIAIFIPSFMGGGVEKMMVYLANNLSSKGIDIDYLVMNNTGPYKKYLSNKVNIVDFNKSRLLYTIIPLARYLRKNKPHVLLSSMNYINIGTYVARLISFTSTRLIISERTIPSLSINKRLSGFLLKKLISLFYRRTYKIIAISQAVKEDLVHNFKIPSNKIVVIYNMVETNNTVLTESEKRKLYDNIFNDHDYSSPIVISIGRLIPLKNFPLLIKAFSKVLPAHPTSKLIILGEGKDRNLLEKLIIRFNLSNNVKLLGFQDNPRKFLQISTIFVSTSLYEGFGNVIIEAMASGLPVIVSDCKGGPKEIVDNGKYGDIVPINDLNNLASIISLRLNHSYDKYISLNRAREFSIEKICQEYLNVMFE